MAHPYESLRASYALISAAQDHPPEQQVAGIAVLFRMVCERCGLDIHEELHRAQRIQEDADNFYAVHVRALGAYIDSQLKGAI
jgi:hypothetical protein